MKHNLDDDEFNALLGMFGSQTAKFKKLRPQTIAFKISYWFINIYSVVIIAIYFHSDQFFRRLCKPKLFTKWIYGCFGRKNAGIPFSVVRF